MAWSFIPRRGKSPVLPTAVPPAAAPRVRQKPGKWPGAVRLARRAAARLAPRLLLLSQEVAGLRAVVANREGGIWRFSEPAFSGISDFAHALDEVLARLRQQGLEPPRRCCIATCLMTPARVDVPVAPEKPRPAAEMRELMRAEMEPVIAEAGAQWSIGAVLYARGVLDAGMRERTTLELEARRMPANSALRFGQVACELGFLTPEVLEDALRQQERLQALETHFACGWNGCAGEAGEAPVWLAGAMGLAAWTQIAAACRRRGLKLLGTLPRLWSASENAEETEETESRIALEIHSEEVIAVLRHRGRIAVTRGMGRMERPLEAGTLTRMVEDWRASGICDLEILCLDARDEPAIRALLEEIGQRWGGTPRFHDAAAARKRIWQALTALARARADGRDDRLPVIRAGLPAQSPFRRAGFWHIAAPTLTLLVIIGLGVRQRLEIRATVARLDAQEFAGQKTANARQQEARVYAEAAQVEKTLAARRQELARLLPEVERLQDIAAMTERLPRLLRLLARNIGDAVVLESVSNASTGGSIGNVRVVGWSPDYGSAQAFALDVQAATEGLGYAVAQTEVRAQKGREGNSGYAVSFWLVPTAEELAQGTEAATTPEIAPEPTPEPAPQTTEEGSTP
ncbi:MAG: hypothetical protein LBC37_05880 [Zoogloeaceae bacterium]|jgi:hypothetical protein|nr:hypothetical protein [Zoogloeaceae bacterium]